MSGIKHEFISDPEEFERRTTEGRGHMASKMLVEEVKKVFDKYPIKTLMLSFVLERFPEEEHSSCRMLRCGDPNAIIQMCHGVVESEMISMAQEQTSR